MLTALLSLTLLTGRPDVVLITIDTLRADHVGAYGSKRGATPTMDALALSGVVVEDAVVQVPMTRPSHTSLMTGLLPFQHGIRDNASAPLAASIPTLSSTFKAAGYSTAAFIAAFPVSRASGLDHGFDVFDDPFSADSDRNERSAREVVDAALAWLAKPSASPRFVWVHLFEPHYPYEPPAPFGARFRTSPYDGEIATADAELKRLLDASASGASRLVAVTSDHGEGLGDHGEDEHHLFVYDSTLRVPLILSGPGLPAGRRVKGQFRSIDLMPTLLELADIAVIPRMTGVSRAQNLRTGAVIPDNESYAESLYGSIHFGYAPVRALRGEGFKYIDTPQAELYRVASDPGEVVNLLAQRQALATAMQTRLRGLHGEDARKQVAAVPLDAATQERLASLGYVASGAGVATASASSTLPDPKTRIVSYQRYSRAVNAALLARRHDDPSGVVKALQPIVAEFATHLTVNSYLGEALLEQKRFNEAVPYLAKARDASAGSGRSWNRLAEALSGSGRRPEALDATEKGLAVSPRSADLIRLRVALLGRLGRGPEAARFLEASSEANPEDGVLLAEVSSLRRNAGDLRAADALSARAITLAPQDADVWLARGLSLGALGRVPAAAEALDRATQLNPSGADAWFYGATLAIQAGDRDRAAKMIARVQALDPQRAGLREVTAAIQALRSKNAATNASKDAPTAAGAIRLSLIKSRTREGSAEVIRRIAAGEDFSALARSLSLDPSAARGGDLGVVRPSDLLPALATAAKSLTPGGVSAILEVADGFVVLRRNP